MSAAVNVNEEVPLLQSSVGVEEQSKGGSPNSRVNDFRLAHIAVAAVTLILTASLAAADLLFPQREWTYEPRTTAADVVAASLLLLVAVIFSVLSRTPFSWDVGQYAGLLVFIASLSKLWVYQAWTATPAITTVIFWTLASSWFHALLFHWSSASSSAETKSGVRLVAARRILKPYFVPRGLMNKIFVILTWVVLILSKVCGIFSPLLLGDIVSNLSQSPPKDSMHLIAVYFALQFSPSILSEIQDMLYVKVGQVAYAQVAEETFTHVQCLSLEWNLKKKMGSVVRSMDRGLNGADTLMYYLMIFLFPAIASAIAAFVVFCVHFETPEVAAICFFAFGFYCWITLVVTVWKNKFQQEVNEHDNDMHDKASDALINFETVKAFTNEAFEIDNYITSVRAFQAGTVKRQASTSALNISQAGTIQLSMMGALMVAAYAITHREDGFDVGSFVAIQSYILTIFEPLSYLGVVYSMVFQSLVDLENLSDLLSETPDIVDDPHAKPIRAATRDGVSVEFRDVKFRYPTAGPQQGLKGVSFTVPAGTTTAIVGPTGSGKTTISRLLFRFYDPVEGGVYINGENIRHCTQKSVRGLIGVVPQDTVMFNESVRYNIRYGKLGATDAEVEEVARKAQVHDFVMGFEKQYDTICGERGLKMSGGEKQRVAIARCLLKNPPIVLLDEATSALDNKTEKEVQAALACLEGRTTIIIAHRLTTVKRADQILVVNAGSIVERGSHAELMQKGGLYAEMYNAQLSTDEQQLPTPPAADM